jgi:beta-phosphoglucomutase
MKATIFIPDLGVFDETSGLVRLENTSDKRFATGKHGVSLVSSTGDGKVEFVSLETSSLAHVRSALGYSAYYPVPTARMGKVQALLMDLDGTTVRSEEFWMWIIQQAVGSLLKDSKFSLEESDVPHVSGHSVSEHLQYCISKYCPDRTLEDARAFYFEHTRREMAEIMAGRGNPESFVPTDGLKDFLLWAKGQKLKLGLVTSGLHEKAYPEIVAAFRTLNLGDPVEFYDCIITAGYPLQPGSCGTLGELSPKPHPWLYAEAGRVGLGISFEDRDSVVAIEDSGAGVCSSRLAGYYTVGLGGGNINESGCRAMCNHFTETLTALQSHLCL